MSDFSSENTKLIKAMAPLVGTGVGVALVAPSAIKGLKSLVTTAKDYRDEKYKIISADEAHIQAIRSVELEYDGYEKKLKKINRISDSSELQTKMVDLDTYKSPILELIRMQKQLQGFNNNLIDINPNVITGYDTFGNAIIGTSSSLKQYLAILEQTKVKELALEKVDVAKRFISDLTKTGGSEKVKEELKSLASEFPVIGKLISSNIVIGTRQAIGTVQKELNKLITSRNENPISTAFDSDIKKLEDSLSKLRDNFKSSVSDLKKTLSDIDLQGLSAEDIIDVFSSPDLKKGYELLLEYDVKFNTPFTKGKADIGDLIGKQVLGGINPRITPVLEAIPELTLERTKEAGIQPLEGKKEVSLRSGDIAILNDEFSKDYNVAGRQALIDVKDTDNIILEYFDKRQNELKRKTFDITDISPFVQAILPTKQIMDATEDKLQQLNAFVVGASAGISSMDNRLLLERNLDLGGRFFSDISTGTLVQSDKGYNPITETFGTQSEKQGYAADFKKYFSDPMNDYSKQMNQLKSLTYEGIDTSEVQLVGALREELSNMQSILKNNQIVFQYRAVHEDLNKTLEEGTRVLEQNINLEKQRQKVDTHSTGFLSGVAKELDNLDLGNYDFSSLNTQQKLLSESDSYRQTAGTVKVREIALEGVKQQLNEIEKAKLAITSIDKLNTGFGNKITPDQFEQFVKITDTGGSPIDAKMLLQNEAILKEEKLTNSNLEELINIMGNEDDIAGKLSASLERNVSSKTSVLPIAAIKDLSSLGNIREKAIKGENYEFAAKIDQVMNTFSAKLIGTVGTDKVFKAISANKALNLVNPFSKQISKEEFIGRSIRGANLSPEKFIADLDKSQKKGWSLFNSSIKDSQNYKQFISLRENNSNESFIKSKDVVKAAAALAVATQFSKLSQGSKSSELAKQSQSLEERIDFATKSKATPAVISALEKELKATRIAYEKSDKMSAIYGVTQAASGIVGGSTLLAQTLGASEGTAKGTAAVALGTYGLLKMLSKSVGQDLPTYVKEFGDNVKPYMKKFSEGKEVGDYKFKKMTEDFVKTYKEESKRATGTEQGKVAAQTKKEYDSLSSKELKELNKMSKEFYEKASTKVDEKSLTLLKTLTVGLTAAFAGYAAKQPDTRRNTLVNNAQRESEAFNSLLASNTKYVDDVFKRTVKQQDDSSIISQKQEQTTESKLINPDDEKKKQLQLLDNKSESISKELQSILKTQARDIASLDAANLLREAQSRLEDYVLSIRDSFVEFSVQKRLGGPLSTGNKLEGYEEDAVFPSFIKDMSAQARTFAKYKDEKVRGGTFGGAIKDSIGNGFNAIISGIGNKFEQLLTPFTNFNEFMASYKVGDMTYSDQTGVYNRLGKQQQSYIGLGSVISKEIMKLNTVINTSGQNKQVKNAAEDRKDDLEDLYRKLIEESDKTKDHLNQLGTALSNFNSYTESLQKLNNVIKELSVTRVVNNLKGMKEYQENISKMVGGSHPSAATNITYEQERMGERVGIDLTNRKSTKYDVEEVQTLNAIQKGDTSLETMMKYLDIRKQENRDSSNDTKQKEEDIFRASLQPYEEFITSLQRLKGMEGVGSKEGKDITSVMESLADNMARATDMITVKQAKIELKDSFGFFERGNKTYKDEMQRLKAMDPYDTVRRGMPVKEMEKFKKGGEYDELLTKSLLEIPSLDMKEMTLAVADPITEKLDISNKLLSALVKESGGMSRLDIKDLFNPEKKASGGRIFGAGGPRDDKVPAYLSPGEFVIRQSAAVDIGYANLEHMNQAGSIPKFGAGGKLTKQHISGAISYFNDEDGSLPDVFNPESKLFNKGITKRYLKYYKETLPQKVQERDDIKSIKSLKDLYNTLLDVSDGGIYTQNDLFLEDYSPLFKRLKEDNKPALTKWVEKNLRGTKSTATKGTRGIIGMNIEEALKEKDGGLIPRLASGGFLESIASGKGFRHVSDKMRGAQNWLEKKRLDSVYTENFSIGNLLKQGAFATAELGTRLGKMPMDMFSMIEGTSDLGISGLKDVGSQLYTAASGKIKNDGVVGTLKDIGTAGMDALKDSISKGGLGITSEVLAAVTGIGVTKQLAKLDKASIPKLFLNERGSLNFPVPKMLQSKIDGVTKSSGHYSNKDILDVYRRQAGTPSELVDEELVNITEDNIGTLINLTRPKIGSSVKELKEAELLHKQLRASMVKVKTYSDSDLISMLRSEAKEKLSNELWQKRLNLITDSHIKTKNIQKSNITKEALNSLENKAFGKLKKIEKQPLLSTNDYIKQAGFPADMPSSELNALKNQVRQAKSFAKANNVQFNGLQRTHNPDPEKSAAFFYTLSDKAEYTKGVDLGLTWQGYGGQDPIKVMEKAKVLNLQKLQDISTSDMKKKVEMVKQSEVKLTPAQELTKKLEAKAFGLKEGGIVNWINNFGTSNEISKGIDTLQNQKNKYGKFNKGITKDLDTKDSKFNWQKLKERFFGGGTTGVEFQDTIDKWQKGELKKSDGGLIQKFENGGLLSGPGWLESFKKESDEFEKVSYLGKAAKKQSTYKSFTGDSSDAQEVSSTDYAKSITNSQLPTSNVEDLPFESKSLDEAVSSSNESSNKLKFFDRHKNNFNTYRGITSSLEVKAAPTTFHADQLKSTIDIAKKRNDFIPYTNSELDNLVQLGNVDQLNKRIKAYDGTDTVAPVALFNSLAKARRKTTNVDDPSLTNTVDKTIKDPSQPNSFKTIEDFLAAGFSEQEANSIIVPDFKKEDGLFGFKGTHRDLMKIKSEFREERLSGKHGPQKEVDFYMAELGTTLLSTLTGLMAMAESPIETTKNLKSSLDSIAGLAQDKILNDGVYQTGKDTAKAAGTMLWDDLKTGGVGTLATLIDLFVGSKVSTIRKIPSSMGTARSTVPKILKPQAGMSSNTIKYFKKPVDVDTMITPSELKELDRMLKPQAGASTSVIKDYFKNKKPSMFTNIGDKFSNVKSKMKSYLPSFSKSKKDLSLNNRRKNQILMDLENNPSLMSRLQGRVTTDKNIYDVMEQYASNKVRSEDFMQMVGSAVRKPKDIINKYSPIMGNKFSNFGDIIASKFSKTTRDKRKFERAKKNAKRGKTNIDKQRKFAKDQAIYNRTIKQQLHSEPTTSRNQFLDGIYSSFDDLTSAPSRVTNIKETLGLKTIKENLNKFKSSKIDINSADYFELQKIPGVGPVRAEAIMDYREKIGAFENISALGDVPGVPLSVFNKNKDIITSVQRPTIDTTPITKPMYSVYDMFANVKSKAEAAKPFVEDLVPNKLSKSRVAAAATGSEKINKNEIKKVLKKIQKAVDKGKMEKANKILNAAEKKYGVAYEKFAQGGTVGFKTPQYFNTGTTDLIKDLEKEKELPLWGYNTWKDVSTIFTEEERNKAINRQLFGVEFGKKSDEEVRLLKNDRLVAKAITSGTIKQYLASASRVRDGVVKLQGKDGFHDIDINGRILAGKVGIGAYRADTPEERKKLESYKVPKSEILEQQKNYFDKKEKIATLRNDFFSSNDFSRELPKELRGTSSAKYYNYLKNIHNLRAINKKKHLDLDGKFFKKDERAALEKDSEYMDWAAQFTGPIMEKLAKGERPESLIMKIKTGNSLRPYENLSLSEAVNAAGRVAGAKLQGFQSKDFEDKYGFDETSAFFVSPSLLEAAKSGDEEAANRLRLMTTDKKEYLKLISNKKEDQASAVEFYKKFFVVNSGQKYYGEGSIKELLKQLTEMKGSGIASVTPQKAAWGGRIFGAGGPMDDKVPAYVSPGEFVVRAPAAKKLGYATLDFMNQSGNVPKFSTGSEQKTDFSNLSMNPLASSAMNKTTNVKATLENNIVKLENDVVKLDKDTIKAKLDGPIEVKLENDTVKLESDTVKLEDNIVKLESNTITAVMDGPVAAELKDNIVQLESNIVRLENDSITAVIDSPVEAILSDNVVKLDVSALGNIGTDIASAITSALSNLDLGSTVGAAQTNLDDFMNKWNDRIPTLIIEGIDKEIEVLAGNTQQVAPQYNNDLIEKVNYLTNVIDSTQEDLRTLRISYDQRIGDAEYNAKEARNINT